MLGVSVALPQYSKCHNSSIFPALSESLQGLYQPCLAPISAICLYIGCFILASLFILGEVEPPTREYKFEKSTATPYPWAPPPVLLPNLTAEEIKYGILFELSSAIHLLNEAAGAGAK